MATYYNRLKHGNKYSGRSAIDTSSNTVIPYSRGPVPNRTLRSGLTLNKTASATSTVAAEEGTNPA